MDEGTGGWWPFRFIGVAGKSLFDLETKSWHECTIGDSESILFAKSLKLKLLICRIAQRYHVIRKMALLIHCFVILVIE
jgi:hypothetical protein